MQLEPRKKKLKIVIYYYCINSFFAPIEIKQQFKVRANVNDAVVS